MPLSGETSTNLQARPCSTRGWKRGERGEREKEGRKGEGYTSEAEDGSTKRSGTRGKQQPTTPLVEGVCRRNSVAVPLPAALSDRSTPPRPPRLLSLFLSSSSSSSSCCVSRRRRSLRRGKRRGRVGRLLSATLHLILRALRRP